MAKTTFNRGKHRGGNDVTGLLVQPCPSCRRSVHECALDPCTGMRFNERWGKTCECGCGESIRADRHYAQGHRPPPSVQIKTRAKRRGTRTLPLPEERAALELRLLCSEQHEELRHPDSAYYSHFLPSALISLDGGHGDDGTGDPDWFAAVAGAVHFDREEDMWPYYAGTHAKFRRSRGKR